MSQNSVQLFTINKSVECLSCGNKGAVKAYGTFYPKGLGEKYKDDVVLSKYWNTPHLSPAVGFGGTIPHTCLNCGNSGLIDMGGLEGYEMAFKSIEEDRNNDN